MTAPPFVPTPMHPSCCAACAKPMLHTCAPHIRLCRACEAAPPRLTHGRHCPCSACAREDWTRIVAPCGMHGPGCPAVYAPLVTL